MRGANLGKTNRARSLRRSSTDAEYRLWNRIRSRAINGHKFLRQEPIGRYFVDFVCRERRLVIEVDGGQHATNDHDEVRHRWLIDHGYRVLRFWNNDVMSNVDGVLQVIAEALDVDGPPHPLASLATSPRKRGEVKPSLPKGR